MSCGSPMAAKITCRGDSVDCLGRPKHGEVQALKATLANSKQRSLQVFMSF